MLLASSLCACRPGTQRVDRSIQQASQVEDATPEVAVVAPAQKPAPAPAVPEPVTPVAAPEPLPGLDGAAALLAAGEPARTLEHLATEPAPEVGTADWFRRGLITGRAARALGRDVDAVAALEPIVEHRKLRTFPGDEIVRHEYALALAGEARVLSSQGDRAGADRLRKRAVSELSKARKHKEVRTLPAIRVDEAKVLAEIEGTGGASTKIAANKAIKTLASVLADYPNCPQYGALRLLRAQAMIRAGKVGDAADELRAIAIDRAGEPEADEAWRSLEALAERERSVHLRPFSLVDDLRRAENARSLRRVDLSREILDRVIDDPKTPESVRRQARKSRAWTANKQKDYDTCADDFAEVYQHQGGLELREDWIRCLERAARYDEAIDLLLERADKRGLIGKQAIWAAIGMAVRGGKYQRAQELLDQFGRKYNAYRDQRLWYDAWLKMRLGQLDAAVAAFAVVEKKVRKDAGRARYFRGRLLVASASPEDRDEGATILRRMAEKEPLSYYGLQARMRLLDAGIDPGTPPRIEPMADEAQRPDFTAVQAVYTAALGELGDAMPALSRSATLHASGYLEEARRELRIAVDEYLAVRSHGGGYTPRNEDYIAGLGWKSSWSLPKARPSRAARKILRDNDIAARVGDNLRTLSLALDEPHRYARLTPSVSYPYRSRWHIRAFRPVLEAAAADRELDPHHLWALMYTESRFRRHVVSVVGARGALQIMPWTGRQLAERLGECDGSFDADTLFDIETNARLASYYVDELMKKFHGQAPMAYASYNGGPFNVSRWLAAKAAGGQPLELDVFIEEIPFVETGRYTRRVLEIKAAYDLMYRGELPRWSNAVDPAFEDNINF
ncbi:MAG: lytic transglycosylase domain-containing protein [Myxococcales bacterium]|nr:lytic transglycosylase domain-containing protein [Myxococcales bacterium]